MSSSGARTFPWRAAVLLLAGVLLLAVSAVHGFANVAHLREDLRELHVRESLRLAIRLGLMFGAFAGVAFGAIVTLTAVGELRGREGSRSTLLVVAAAYIVFGLYSIRIVGFNIHLFGYSILGFLIASGALLRSSGTRPP